MRFGRLPGIPAKHRRAMALGAALMLLLLLSLPVLAASAAIDPGDYAGEPDIVGSAPGSTAAHGGLIAPALMSALLLLAAILIPEYLSSHFGEKRPAGEVRGLLLPGLFLFNLTTAPQMVPSCVFR